MQDPKEFDYLRDIARKYGDFYFQDDINAFARSVTPAQLAELAAAYDKIDAKDHAYAISRWIQRCLYDKAIRVDNREKRFAQRLGQLFVLFDHLGESGLRPFSSGKVAFIERYRKPHWDNLPKTLHYLIPVAEAYGRFSSDDELLEIVGNATMTDRLALKQAADKIRANNHSPRLREWLRRFSIREHEEAWMIHCLLRLMDHTGLRFS